MPGPARPGPLKIRRLFHVFVHQQRQQEVTNAAKTSMIWPDRASSGGISRLQPDRAGAVSSPCQSGTALFFEAFHRAIGSQLTAAVGPRCTRGFLTMRFSASKSRLTALAMLGAAAIALSACSTLFGSDEEPVAMNGSPFSQGLATAYTNLANQ